MNVVVQKLESVCTLLMTAGSKHVHNSSRIGSYTFNIILLLWALLCLSLSDCNHSDLSQAPYHDALFIHSYYV